ncbi:MAG: hypothetical protein ACOZDY_02635 [Pseudomonadota bacterium]
MKPRAPLFLLLSLLLALGPVGTYAHALRHLGGAVVAAEAAHGDHGISPDRGDREAAHGHTRHGDDGHGHAHHGGGQASHDGEACELFGAHAPLGSAATVAGLPSAATHRPAVPAGVDAVSRPRETRVPYYSTGPPVPPVTI